MKNIIRLSVLQLALVFCFLLFAPLSFAMEPAQEIDSAEGEVTAETETPLELSAAQKSDVGSSEEIESTPCGESTEGASVGSDSALKDEGQIEELKVQGHVAESGWQEKQNVNVSDGEAEVGTTGKSRALEAVKITSSDEEKLAIVGEALSRSHGWLATDETGVTGTTGLSSPMEAVVFRLSGKDASKYQLRYRVHVSNVGWLDWAEEGTVAGAPCRGEAIEAIRFRIALMGATLPQAGGPSYLAPSGASIVYRAHVSGIGWMPRVGDGRTAGTTGEAKAVEALIVESPVDVSGAVVVESHVSEIGWMPGVRQGEICGTVGRSLAMQAIKIHLTGALAEKYDVYYRVHAANYGWLAWTSNGAEAGTTGLAQRLEAVQILLLAKDSSKKPATDGFAAIDRPVVQYSAHVQDIGWQSAVAGGSTSGTTGEGKRIEAVKIWFDSLPFTGGLKYELHLAGIGWQGEVSDGMVAGTTGRGIQAEAIRLLLTDEAAKYFDVYYRVHSEEYGWLGWARNGQIAGTTGIGYRMEAVQIRIVGKDAPAPGSTDGCYQNKKLVRYSPLVQSMVDRAQGFSSSTGWLVLVSRSDCHVAVFSGGRGNWNLYDDFACVVGAPSSPTITGTYATQSRRPSLDTDSRARYCTQINGGYFFHTILSSNSELGHWASHGCVRLPVEKARWIYYNLPLRTTVNIY